MAALPLRKPRQRLGHVRRQADLRHRARQRDQPVLPVGKAREGLFKPGGQILEQPILGRAVGGRGQQAFLQAFLALGQPLEPR